MREYDISQWRLAGTLIHTPWPQGSEQASTAWLFMVCTMCTRPWRPSSPSSSRCRVSKIQHVYVRHFFGTWLQGDCFMGISHIKNRAAGVAGLGEGPTSHH